MESDRPASHISRRSLLISAAAVAGGAVAAGALAACAPTATVPTASLKPSGAASGQPRKGGTLILATGDGLVPDLSFGNSFGPQALSFSQFVWPLFRTKPASFEIVNALADGYEPSADRLTHKITLRAGLTFHDGSPLDATAVAANLRVAFDPKDPLRGTGAYQMIPTMWGGFPGNFKSVAVVDPRTLTISLATARADIRGALLSIFIVNPKVLAANPKGYGTDVAQLRNAGSGPFRVSDFSPGQFVEFTRVDGFFEEAYLDKLRLQQTTDASARYLALKGGQANAATGLSRADYEAASADPGFRTHISNPGGAVFMAFNATKNELLRTNRDVREAIVRAMNRQAYVASFYPKGLAQIATQVALAPGAPGFNPNLTALPYDPESAKALLAKAGVKSLSWTMIDPPAFGGASELKSQMEAIAADLAKVGITIETKVTDVAGYLAGTKDYDVNVTVYGNSIASVGVASLYFRRPPTTYQCPPDPRYATLLGEADVALDVATQNAKLSQVMQIATENVAGAPIAYISVAAVSTAKVHDISMTSSPLDPQHRAWIEA